MPLHALSICRLTSSLFVNFVQAIERAQTQLAAHRQPLDTDADVDAVGLGTKSTQKVKEILKKGHSSRVAAAAKDERAVAIAALMQMWGVGPGIAERWYALGCRTIDEVRGKVDAGELKLTEQQRVGLKYFADLQVAIPRAEIAEAEATVREATFELAERLGATDAELTYCFATGSYRRGKPESSDIDILIVLPPSLVGHPCGDFLHALLTVLLRSGLLLDELDPKGAKAAHHSPVRASWMGVCRPPCSPAVRRIDFKIYGPRGTACAVNYFANSMAFCRATRFWANNNVLCAEAAKSFNPAANGFKISDLEFSPILKKHARELSRGQESITVLGPPIEIENETQLFETLGLAYVPVTMRFFQDFH